MLRDVTFRRKVTLFDEAHSTNFFGMVRVRLADLMPKKLCECASDQSLIARRAAFQAGRAGTSGPLPRPAGGSPRASPRHAGPPARRRVWRRGTSTCGSGTTIAPMRPSTPRRIACAFADPDLPSTAPMMATGLLRRTLRPVAARLDVQLLLAPARVEPTSRQGPRRTRCSAAHASSGL